MEDALARALVTSSSTVRSWAANPLTVSTRFGIRSARRWYTFCTCAHFSFTSCSLVTNWLLMPVPQTIAPTMMRATTISTTRPVFMTESIPDSEAARLTPREPRARTNSRHPDRPGSSRSYPHGSHLHAGRHRVPQASPRLARAEHSVSSHHDARAAAAVASTSLRGRVPRNGMAEAVRRRRGAADGASHRGRRDGAGQRAGADQRTRPGHRRPHDRGAWQRGPETAVPPEDPDRRGAVVPALLGAQRRFRSRLAQDERRGAGRSLRGERPEDLDEWRPDRGLGIAPGAHQYRSAEAQGHLVLLDEHAAAGRGGEAAQADHRVLGVLRSVHDERARREVRPDRQARRRLGHRPDHARLRAGWPVARARHELRRPVRQPGERRATLEASRTAARRRPHGTPEARAHLGRARGGALFRAPRPDPARAR